MAVNCLVDTGPLLAILDRTDPWHAACRETIRQLSLPLLTSQAVLTELFHLVRPTRRELETVWSFLRSGTILIAPIHQEELADLHALMSQYWNCPMDFADATLVHIAKRESISTIFTIDHSDFATYRIGAKRKFRILPPPPGK